MYRSFKGIWPLKLVRCGHCVHHTTSLIFPWQSIISVPEMGFYHHDCHHFEAQSIVDDLNRDSDEPYERLENLLWCEHGEG